ncbi:hypothetical protein ACTG9Q_04745 [Actinokineospora sp. 24-640]
MTAYGCALAWLPASLVTDVLVTVVNREAGAGALADVPVHLIR